MIYSGIPIYDKSSELITIINKILAEPWSDRQIKNGKKIEVPLEWGADVIGFTAARYRHEGWIVTRIVQISSQTRTYFLSFQNPKWKKRSDQFSQVAP